MFSMLCCRDEAGNWKLEIGNLKLGARMKEVYELDVYRLAEELSDLIWVAYDEWTPKAQNTRGIK